MEEKISQVQKSINAIENQKRKLIVRIEARMKSCQDRLVKDNALLAGLKEELAIVRGKEDREAA